MPSQVEPADQSMRPHCRR